MDWPKLDWPKLVKSRWPKRDWPKSVSSDADSGSAKVAIENDAVKVESWRYWSVRRTDYKESDGELMLVMDMHVGECHLEHAEGCDHENLDINLYIVEQKFAR